MKSNLNCSHAKQTFAYFKVASFLKMRHSFNHENELIYWKNDVVLINKYQIVILFFEYACNMNCSIILWWYLAIRNIYMHIYITFRIVDIIGTCAHLADCVMYDVITSHRCAWLSRSNKTPAERFILQITLLKVIKNQTSQNLH